jgi:hypothetical protein
MTSFIRTIFHGSSNQNLIVFRLKEEIEINVVDFDRSPLVKQGTASTVEMIKVSTELILSIVAAATGTTTFLVGVLIFCMYCIHRSNQKREGQEQNESQSPTVSRDSNSDKKQNTINSNEMTINTSRHREKNHQVSNMTRNRNADSKGTKSKYTDGIKEDSGDDEEDIVKSNTISIPTVVVRTISTGSSRGGTIARGHHASHTQTDHLSTSSDHNKKTISIGGFSLPINFGTSNNNEKLDKNGKGKGGNPNSDSKNNNETALVDKKLHKNSGTPNRKTSKGTILHPTPKSKSDETNSDGQPKIRRFSSSSSGISNDPSPSSSSSSVSYIITPKINEFSFSQTNNSVGHYNDDDSHDIHTFDDNWSYAMVSVVCDFF